MLFKNVINSNEYNLLIDVCVCLRSLTLDHQIVENSKSSDSLSNTFLCYNKYMMTLTISFTIQKTLHNYSMFIHQTLTCILFCFAGPPTTAMPSTKDPPTGGTTVRPWRAPGATRTRKTPPGAPPPLPRTSLPPSPRPPTCIRGAGAGPSTHLPITCTGRDTFRWVELFTCCCCSCCCCEGRKVKVADVWKVFVYRNVWL